MSLISHFIVENIPRSPDYVFTQPGAISFDTNSDDVMARENGTYHPKEEVQPVQLDKVIDAVTTYPKVNGITNGINGHPTVNGTNGVKPSSSWITYLGDTSLPPAAIEVSLEVSGTCIPKLMQ